MDILTAIIVIIICAAFSTFMYGIWKVENNRYEYRKKHGIDPKYHGWTLDNNDTQDKDQ